MRIDQRNAGASVSTTTANTSVYTVDRWAYYCTQISKFTVQQNAGSVTPPAAFVNYLGVTTAASTYSPGVSEEFDIVQVIEGYNISDFAWGTANAKTVTLSFWVRSSLTGTFGGSLRQGSGARSYPFTYSIASANTWTYVTITIPGDTSGTWATTNTAGIILSFGIGVGSTLSGTAFSWAGANYVSATGALNILGTGSSTFYITGVQLEVGSVATPYERQIYSDQLAQCQRYYQLVYATIRLPVTSGASYWTQANMLVSMRATPTATATSTYEFRANLGSVTATAAGVNAVELQTTATGTGDGYTTQNLIICSSEL